MGRYENIRVFEDTQFLCGSNPVLKKAVQKSIENQKLILEGDVYPSSSGRRIYDMPAKINVSGRRSFSAALQYSGSRVCVLNFASATNPGGGVTRGSSAQEECLCRCSTLYALLNTKVMWDGFYGPHRRTRNPLHNDDCVYTPDIIIFKTDTSEPRIQPERMWSTVDVLTCAAPNLRVRPGNEMNPGEGDEQVIISNSELQKLQEKRIRRISDIAVENGAEVLILGAFGCGAFQNPPEIVAMAMRNVIEEYKYCFKVIEFAVYCSPRDDENYRVFSRIIDQR